MYIYIYIHTFVCMYVLVCLIDIRITPFIDSNQDGVRVLRKDFHFLKQIDTAFSFEMNDK